MFPRFIVFYNTFKKKKKSANNNFKLSMQLSPEQFVQMYSRAVVRGVLGLLQHPRNLGVLLTLFQPDTSIPLLLSTPGFQNPTTALHYHCNIALQLKFFLPKFFFLEVIFIKQNLRFGKLRDGREFGFTIEVDIREHSYMTSDFWVGWQVKLYLILLNRLIQ